MEEEEEVVMKEETPRRESGPRPSLTTRGRYC